MADLAAGAIGVTRLTRKSRTGQAIEMVQKDAESFEEELCLAIQRMLISPPFLFQVKKESRTDTSTTGNAPVVLPVVEHAGRGTPSLCGRGKLRQPECWRTRCGGCSKTPRSARWWRTSAAMASDTARSNRTHPTARSSRNSPTTRRMSMKETELFFEHILRDDRPVLDFLDADYTFLNQQLAEFYGIPKVKGHEFRKVDLTGKRSRRSLATRERADRLVVPRPNLPRATRQVDSREPSERSVAPAAAGRSDPGRQRTRQVRFSARATGEAPQ